MLSLSDPLVVPDWNDTLRVLKAEDVHGLSEALMGDSEGKRRPLWIWTMNMGVVGVVQIRQETKVCTCSYYPTCRS